VPYQEHEPELEQLTFSGLEDLDAEKITVERCLVTREPTYAKRKKGAVRECAVYAPPDLFHQEQNDTYQLHATTYASEVNKKRLKLGDVVTVTGTLTVQQVMLQNGTLAVLKRLAVSDVLVISRAIRKTVTIFEAEQKKQP